MPGWLVPLLLFAAQQDDPNPILPHYMAQDQVCPVGGEAFRAGVLMHYSTFGELPDGQPIGSIGFPRLLPQCPGNGMVLYRDFTAAEAAALEPVVLGAEYQAMRAAQTRYYRASYLARALGDDVADWLLLSATWEAKNEGDPARAAEYNARFAEAAGARSRTEKALDAVALGARGVNALRELGRFDAAEAERVRLLALFADPAIAMEADNRTGWTQFLTDMKAPIARRDSGRAPIDLVDPRFAAQRCLSETLAKRWDAPPPPPLDSFEAAFCATPSPELAQALAQLRTNLDD